MKRFCALWLIFMLGSTAGCGGKGVPINGTVTFNGEPVGIGSISFEPADGQGPSTGGQIINGRYLLTGDASPLPGKKIVRILASRKTGRKVQGDALTTPTRVLVDEIEQYIPDIYNVRSTLTTEVSRNKTNEIDFRLISQ